MTLQYVPIIDLAPYFAGTPEGKLQVARAVDQACRDIGFLVITNHQIPTELVERVSRLTRQFFALPLAEMALILTRPLITPVQWSSLSPRWQI